MHLTERCAGVIVLESEQETQLGQAEHNSCNTQNQLISFPENHDCLDTEVIKFSNHIAIESFLLNLSAGFSN